MSNKRGGDMEKAKRVEVDDDLRTDRQVLFGIEYCKDFNGTQSAIRAGYAERSAAEIACELLRKPQIQAAIARRLAAAADAAQVSAELVISELYQLATADSRELMRVETDCCRHCYGIEHRYQWTPAEFVRAANDAIKNGTPAPELAGGVGFDPRRPPVDSCVECHGRGVERVVITPSKKLSRGAARLISSVKQTKDGCIELKTRDQDGALLALAKITGVFAPERTEHSGPGGGPLQLQPIALTNAQLQEILKRNGRLIEGSTSSER
jgi:phage terminase small subunit